MVDVSFIKTQCKTGSNSVTVQRSANVRIVYCYMLGGGPHSTQGGPQGFAILATEGSNVNVKHTYVNQAIGGIAAFQQSIVVSNTNNGASGPQAPIYGLYVNAGIIFRNSTQPPGHTANTFITNGGQIF